jgi:PAS domain-containing protein
MAEPEHALGGGRAIHAGARDWLPKDSPIFLALGRILAHVVEHAQAEREIARLQQAVRTAKTLLEELMESAPRAALILDSDGRIQHCNAAAEQLLYRPRNRIIGHLFTDFLPKHQLACYRDAIERASRPLGRDLMFEAGLVPAGEAERFQLQLRAVAVDGGGRLAIIWLQPAAAADMSDSAATMQLWQLLQDVAASGRSRVPVAQVHLLGLDEVRNLLGDRWPELEHSVHRIVERVLKRFLLPHERYCRDGNKGYMLVFAQASSEQAAERAAMIAAAIEAAVLGADDLDRRARTLVPPLAAAERAALARVATQVREAELGEPGLTVIAEAGAGQASGTPMRPAESDPLTALERQVRETLRIELEPVYDRAGLPTAMVLGQPDPQGNLLLAQLRQRAGELPRALLVHDICVLDAMLMALDQEPEPDQLLAVTEVHYETLASRRWADSYLVRLRQVDSRLKPALGLLIVGVPPGT